MQQRARLRVRLSAVGQTTDADRHQRSEVMIRTLYAEAAQTLTEFFEDARSGRRRLWLQSASWEGAAPYTTLKQRMADKTMSKSTSSEAAKAIVRRNTEEVQGKGNFDVFEELFADDFVDHTPQPNMTPDKPGARDLYKALREAFPDFHAVIHWQTADGEIVTTFKTYHGTHQGTFLGVPPTGRKIHFETVDAMRVHNGRITEHWGVANLFSLMQQLGAAVGSKRAQTGT